MTDSDDIPETAQQPAGDNRPGRGQRLLGCMKHAAGQAARSFRRLLSDPLTRLSAVHDELDPRTRLIVGVVFAVAAAFGLALGTALLLKSLSQLVFGVSGLYIGFFLRSLVAQVFAIAAAAAVLLVVAPVLGRRLAPSSSLYLAGASFLFLGLAMLLAAILGGVFSGRLGLVLMSLMLVLGICCAVQVLNVGLRQLANMNDRRAFWVTPVVLGTAFAVMSWFGWLFA